MCLLHLWLVIPIITRCCTVLLIIWLIGSCMSCINSHWMKFQVYLHLFSTCCLWSCQLCLTTNLITICTIKKYQGVKEVHFLASVGWKMMICISVSLTKWYLALFCCCNCCHSNLQVVVVSSELIQLNPSSIYTYNTLFIYWCQTCITFPLVTTEITEPRLALWWISSVNYPTCILFLRV